MFGTNVMEDRDDWWLAAVPEWVADWSDIDKTIKRQNVDSDLEVVHVSRKMFWTLKWETDHM